MNPADNQTVSEIGRRGEGHKPACCHQF